MKASMTELLEKATRGNYAIPAANFIDWHTAEAYVKVSEKLNLPLILAFAQAHSEWLGLEKAAVIGKFFQENSTVPIVLHLDHGQDTEFIKRAIALGFNSVMMDASLDSFEENVRKTREIIEVARPLGIAVEAEIGFVGANENLENHQVIESVYTTVEEAERFVEATQVDTLAISIGTAHGLYKGEPKINFERLAEIREAISIPLVLHGGSSSGDDNLHKCAKGGIAKINLFSDLIQAGYKGSKQEAIYDYPSLIQKVEQGIQAELEHYYGVFDTK